MKCSPLFFLKTKQHITNWIFIRTNCYLLPEKQWGDITPIVITRQQFQNGDIVVLEHEWHSSNGQSFIDHVEQVLQCYPVQFTTTKPIKPFTSLITVLQFRFHPNSPHF